MSEHSFSRLKRVFGMTEAQICLALGLLGPTIYGFGYLVIAEIGFATSGGRLWDLVAGLWMLGFPPVVAVPGLVLGFRGFERDGRLPAGLGLTAHCLWLLVWAVVALLVVTRATV